MAISAKEILELEQTLKRIEAKGLKEKMPDEYESGNRLLVKLRGMERMRHEIMELKQPTISEIRSYTSPPLAVEKVMMGTFIILGNEEKEINQWKRIRALIGKIGNQSVKQRISRFSVESCDKWRVTRAENLIKNLTLDEIRDVSAGAAAFYVWLDAVVETCKDESNL